MSPDRGAATALRVIDVRAALPDDPVPLDVVVLDYESRWVRRRVLEAVHGDRVALDLPETQRLPDRARLVTQDGAHYEVIAAGEDLLEITAPELPRLAWHIGNRHAPCQIEPDRLLVQADHVLRDMLERLGATVREVREPFQPEGGAYGHGRTHGHSHSHDPHADPDAHLR